MKISKNVVDAIFYQVASNVIAIICIIVVIITTIVLWRNVEIHQYALAMEFIVAISGFGSLISQILFSLLALFWLFFAGIATLRGEKEDAKLFLLFCISCGILAI